MEPSNHIAHSQAFNAAASRHARATAGLCVAFVCFYFALLLGAAYCKDAFTTMVSGRVNVGLLFALAQYVVAGLVAWLYTKVMRETDRAMESFKN